MYTTNDLITFLIKSEIKFKHNGVMVRFCNCSPFYEANDLSVVWNKKFEFESTLANTVILPYSEAGLGLESIKKCIVTVENPRLVYLRVLKKFFYKNLELKVAPEKRLAESVMVGEGSIVYPGVTFGKNVVIHHNVVIYPNVAIGSNVEIESGCVIGSKGFGYEKNESAGYEHFPHLGGVVIGDDVEIGANTCIDRGTLGDTVVGEGSKVSNFCQIAHNAVIGENCLITGKAQIGGGATIGRNSYIGPSVVISNKVNIGEHCDVKIGSVVVSDVENKASVSGNFAIPHSKSLRQHAKKIK